MEIKKPNRPFPGIGNQPTATPTTQPPTPPAKDLHDIAVAVIRGEYGNGEERKQKLTAAGYNYDEVQALVNKYIKDGIPSKPTPPTGGTIKPLDVVAKEVIQGKYGNGAERKAKLEAEGYNYDQVQALVNQMLK